MHKLNNQYYFPYFVHANFSLPLLCIIALLTGLKSDLKDKSIELKHIRDVLVSKEKEFQESYAVARQHLWKQSAEHQEER